MICAMVDIFWSRLLPSFAGLVLQRENDPVSAETSILSVATMNLLMTPTNSSANCLAMIDLVLGPLSGG